MNSAVTRIRTGVAAATTQSTNHYTITAPCLMLDLHVLATVSLLSFHNLSLEDQYTTVLSVWVSS